MTDWVATVPGWLLVGLALGAAFTLLAAVAFLAGTRLFPDPERATHVPGETRRRAEIREYLEAIGERYAEDHPVGGQEVAFFLPERDVAITFDARAYFRIEGTGVHPVLVEHELPGAALGARLPFETPDPTPAGGDADDAPAVPDPVGAAFRVLGLPGDADLDAVKAAYRERAKAVHPDQGGDPEEFQRVREAYTVAREAVS